MKAACDTSVVQVVLCHSHSHEGKKKAGFELLGFLGIIDSTAVVFQLKVGVGSLAEPFCIVSVLPRLHSVPQELYVGPRL